jgi:hypothetical protein
VGIFTPLGVVQDAVVKGVFVPNEIPIPVALLLPSIDVMDTKVLVKLI